MWKTRLFLAVHAEISLLSAAFGLPVLSWVRHRSTDGRQGLNLVGQAKVTGRF